MKPIYVIALVCIILPNLVKGQSTSLLPNDTFYSDYIGKHYPKLKFSYEETTQTFDYSGNWDFDGDGKKDSLFFVGNGGAHVYYHLVLILSSDRLVRNFSNFIEIDFPLLADSSELQNRDKEPKDHPQFIVADFNSDSKKDIYININNGFASIPSKWKKRGVTSFEIIIFCSNKYLKIKNYD